MTVLQLRRQSEERRVLLLEDHDLLRSSMVRALAELPNVSVVGVRTVREALEEIDTARPDLVVSDLDLPDGSGLELMPRLSGRNQPAVVFVSGHISRFESQLDHYPGVVVLDKPLPARTLKFIVAEQLDTDRTSAPPFAAGDYVQLACLGRHSVRIDVQGHDIDGSIYIKLGRLWSANSGRRNGLSALRRLIFTEGTHVACSGAPLDPGPSNLPDLPWEQMLLDLAKQHDEGTREIPIAEQEPSDEDIDFSDIFDETESSAPQPTSPAPNISELPEVPEIPKTREVPKVDDDAATEARFERLLDDAHDALLKKDYRAALLAYETAEALRPDDSMVKGNVARLRELVEK